MPSKNDAIAKGGGRVNQTAPRVVLPAKKPVVTPVRPRRQIDLDDDDEEDGVGALEKSRRGAPASLVPASVGTPSTNGENPYRTATWTDRLLSDGNPQPLYILRNRQEKGYVCPRAQFVESIQAITLPNIAEMWNVSVSTIRAWYGDQQWAMQRERFWQDVNRRMWEQSPNDLASMRGQALQRAIGGYQELQGLTLDMARSGGKFKMSPVTGESEFVAFDPQDVGRINKAYDIAVKGELGAMGLSFRVADEASDAAQTGDERARPATGMVLVMPMTQAEAIKAIQNGVNPGMALPEGMLENERTIEGEIIENQNADEADYILAQEGEE